MSDKNLDKELEKNENEINESQDKDADKKVTEQQSSDNNSQSEDNKEVEFNGTNKKWYMAAEFKIE